jgi:hypothetical protein
MEALPRALYKVVPQGMKETGEKTQPEVQEQLS